jgi:hypothetical protein
VCVQPLYDLLILICAPNCVVRAENFPKFGEHQQRISPEGARWLKIVSARSRSLCRPPARSLVCRTHSHTHTERTIIVWNTNDFKIVCRCHYVLLPVCIFKAAAAAAAWGIFAGGRAKKRPIGGHIMMIYLRRS